MANMKPGKTDYSSNKVPKKYKCGTCGAHGCKLWREYQTFLDNQTLECCDCAAKSQNKNISTMNSDGSYEYKYGGTIDQIGWRIPAGQNIANDIEQRRREKARILVTDGFSIIEY